jgi:hypothetical protein
VGRVNLESKTDVASLLFEKLKLPPPPNPDKTKWARGRAGARAGWVREGCRVLSVGRVRPPGGLRLAARAAPNAPLCGARRRSAAAARRSRDFRLRSRPRTPHCAPAHPPHLAPTN